MSNANAFARLQHLEAKIDARLFGVYRDPNTGMYKNEDGSPATSTAGTVAKTVAGGAALGGAAYGGYRGVQAVQNRIGGLRATVPGFAQASRASQVTQATGSVARDVGSAVGGAVKSAGSAVLAHPYVAPAVGALSKLKKGAGTMVRRARGIEGAGGQLLLKLSAAQYARELAARIDEDLCELGYDHERYKRASEGFASAIHGSINGGGGDVRAAHEHFKKEYVESGRRRREALVGAGLVGAAGVGTAGYVHREALGRGVVRGTQAVERGARHVGREAMYQGTRGYRHVENVAVGAGRRLRGAALALRGK